MRTELTKSPVIRSQVDDSGVSPPSNVTVDMDRKPVLFLPDGKVLVRRSGF